MRRIVFLGAVALALILASVVWAASSVFVLGTGPGQTIKVNPGQHLYISLKGEAAKNRFSVRLSRNGQTTYQKAGSMGRAQTFRISFPPGKADSCGFQVDSGRVRVMVVWR